MPLELDKLMFLDNQFKKKIGFKSHFEDISHIIQIELILKNFFIC